MELKYMFIKDFNVLKDIDVNFNHGGEHIFKYENEKISLLPNQKSALSFGKAISSITAIAGQNGAGKSSLLEQILAAMATLKNGSIGYNSLFEGIVCFGKHIFIHRSRAVKNQSVLQSFGYNIIHFKESPFENSMSQQGTWHYKTKFIYFSCAIDWRSAIYEHNLYNISTQYLLNKDSLFSRVPRGPSQSTQSNVTDGHYHEEQFRNTYFYLNFPQFLPIQPKTFVINILDRSEIPEQLSKFQMKFFDIRNSILQNISGSSDTKSSPAFSIPKEKLQNILEWNYRLNLIIGYCVAKNAIPEDFDTVSNFVFDNKIIDPFFETDRDLFRKVNRCIRRLINHCEIMTGVSPEKIVQRYNQPDWRITISRRLHCQNTSVARHIIKDLIDVEFILLKNDFSSNQRCLQLTMWPLLSAGQYSLLAFFSRIYFALRHFQTADSDTEDVIILIDEGDVFFHPAWKRLMIKWLVELLNMDFNKFIIQLALTTHSPFLLSDLTASEVILMQRIKGKVTILPKESYRTFGGNIHELLADSFFLEQGTVGEFAVEILERLSEYLRLPNRKREDNRRKQHLSKGFYNGSFDKQSADLLIRNVADPIISERLRDLWNEKFNESSLPTIREEREALLTRLKELENLEKQ